MAAGEGWVLRPVDPETDVAAVYSLVRTHELEAMGWSDVTLDEVEWMMTNPEAMLDEHRVLEVGGVPVGALLVEVQPHGREVFLDPYAVGTDHRPMLDALLQVGLAAAPRLSSVNPAPPQPSGDPYVLAADRWQVLSGAFRQDAAHSAALAGAGFRPIRTFWRMAWDVSGVSSQHLRPPAGVTRRAASNDDDLRIIHALDRDTFSEHFGSTHDEPYDEWLASTLARPGYSIERCWIAELDGEPVGVCIEDDSRAEFGEDHVGLLGVTKAVRGRGIARWLLTCAALDALERGRTVLCLSVDGENTTGATALYDSMGFAQRSVFDVWCYPLPDDATAASA